MSNVTQPGRDTVHPRATAPLVTALVPTYNGAAFIGRTLDSLAAQTWPNLEILIGDDCSTDETLEVVTAFAADRGSPRLQAVERKPAGKALGPNVGYGARPIPSDGHRAQ